MPSLPQCRSRFPFARPRKPRNRRVFGPFELDLRAGELRRSGIRLPLQEKPLAVLVLLLAAPGQLVTREDLRQQLWPDEQFGDFDHMLNNAVSRLRSVLKDAAAQPRYIETVPRRGYRFIASVDWVAANPLPARSAWRVAAAVSLGVMTALALAAWNSEPAQAPRWTSQHTELQPEVLKGRFLWLKKQPEPLLRGRDYFLAASENNEQDANAWYGLADTYNFMGGIGLLERSDAFAKATSAAERALQLDPNLGEAFASLAEARFRLGADEEPVEALFLRARELAPDYAIGRYWYGMYLAHHGRVTEAESEVSVAHQLAPLNLRIQVDLGVVRWLAGDPAAGRRLIEEAQQLDPRSTKAHLGLGWLEWREGRLAKAALAFQRVVELSPDLETLRPRLDALRRATEQHNNPPEEQVAAWRDLAVESIRCQPGTAKMPKARPA